MVYSKFNSNLGPKAAVEALAFNADALAAGRDAGQITSIDIEINGRPVRFDVLGYDIDKVAEIHRRKAEHTATLQMHFLSDEYFPFCDENRKDIDQIVPNTWKTSTLRQRLNEESFIKEHFGGLARYIVPALKETDGVTTEDKIFPLSIEEIDSETTPYPFYQNKESRSRTTSEGDNDCYWTRSANRGNASFTWCVYSSGYVHSGSYAYYAHRALPSLVIALNPEIKGEHLRPEENNITIRKLLENGFVKDNDEIAVCDQNAAGSFFWRYGSWFQDNILEINERAIKRFTWDGKKLEIELKRDDAYDN